MEEILIDNDETERKYECSKCGQSVHVIVKSKFFSMFANRFPKFCPLCGYVVN